MRSVRNLDLGAYGITVVLGPILEGYEAVEGTLGRNALLTRLKNCLTVGKLLHLLKRLNNGMLVLTPILTKSNDLLRDTSFLQEVLYGFALLWVKRLVRNGAKLLLHDRRLLLE